MTEEQLNLLEELKQTEEYSSAILGTYSFGGDFFEDEVLTRLQRLGIRNTTVLTDTEEYKTTDDLGHAGTKYYLDHVRCPQRFHPKFVLLLGHRRGYCLVGSANLTAAGWQHNAELMTEFKYTDAEDDAATAAIFSQLVEFIDGITTTERVPSDKTQTAIEEAKRDAPWLDDASGTSAERSVALLNNLSRPLLKQVSDRIPHQQVDEIEVISPFFSGDDKQVIQSLCEFSPDRLILNIQPDRVQGFDAAAIIDELPKNTDLTVQAITVGDDETRYLHGKLLLFRGTENVWSLYGSPNLTTSALGLPATAGNIELAVLRHESKSDYFDYLLDESVIDRSPIDPTSVAYERYETRDDQPSPTALTLSAAHLETDGSLLLRVDDRVGDSVTVHLENPRTETVLDIPIPDVTVVDGTITIADERVPTFCDGATRVWLTAHLDDDQDSDARWIARSSLESTPRTSEVKQIEESKGRHGLVDLLNRLEGIHAMYDFLDGFNLGQGDIVIDTGGGGGGSGTRDGMGGGGMDERTVSEYRDIFKTKVERFHSNLESATADRDLDETWQEHFSEVLNLFIGGCKLTFWWVERDSHASLNLRYARLAMEDLRDFLRWIRVQEDTEAIHAFEREERLFEHAAIIAYYLDQLLKRNRDIDGADVKVYDIFRGTMQSFLQTCASTRSDPIPNGDALSECLTEYSGLKTRPPSVGKVQSFCKQFFDEE
jgi:HKD family nuclease